MNLIILLIALMTSSCGLSSQPRVALVPEEMWVNGKLSNFVKIGPGGAKCYVYVKIDGKWTKSDNKISIPEGWYCTSPKPVED